MRVASGLTCRLGLTTEGASVPRRFLVERAGERFDLVESPAPSEHHLQEVMKMNPQLIPSDDLGLDRDLLGLGELSIVLGARPRWRRERSTCCASIRRATWCSGQRVVTRAA